MPMKINIIKRTINTNHKTLHFNHRKQTTKSYLKCYKFKALFRKFMKFLVPQAFEKEFLLNIEH